MSDGKPIIGRRTVLRTIGAGSSAAVVGVGTAKDNESDDPTDSKKEQSTELGKLSDIAIYDESRGDHGTTRSLSKEEYESFRRERNNRISELAGAEAPTDEKENLERIDSARREFELSKWGFHLADVEHTLTLFAGYNDGSLAIDNDGYFTYVFEHWAQSDVNDSTLSSRTTELRSGIEIVNPGTDDDWLKLVDRSPKTTTNVDGGWVTMGVSADAGPVGVSASGPVYVSTGEIGPDTYTPGQYGEFSASFIGCKNGRTDFLGYSVVKSYNALHDVLDIVNGNSVVHIDWETYGAARADDMGHCGSWG